jgi:arabinogalactan oligomer/maltooligosaccharide transport system substrate-binding protein
MKRRKGLSLMMGLLLVASLLLAGCGPQEEGAGAEGSGSEEKPEKLVVWANNDPIQLKNTRKLAKEYEKESGIKVEVVPVDLLKQQEKLALDGPAGKGADLVTWPHDQLGEAVIKGLVRPLEVGEDVTGQFSESAVQALTYDGQVYGLPYVTESIALIYNKKLMPEPPESFDELIDFARKNTKPAEKEYGLLYEGANFYYSYFLIDAMGGYIFKEDSGKVNTEELGLNNEGAKKALKMLQGWYKEKLLPVKVTADTVNGLFKEGKAAAVINGPWAVKDYEQAGIDFAVAPLPSFDGKHPRTFIGVKGWYVSAYSKNPTWATDLMKFFTSKESLLLRFQETGEIPPRKDLLEDPVIKDDPVVNGFAQQASRGTPMPNVPEMGQVWEPIGNAITFVAQGKQSPEQALDDAVKMIREKIQAQKQ